MHVLDDDMMDDYFELQLTDVEAARLLDDIDTLTRGDMALLDEGDATIADLYEALSERIDHY